ncbi:MAG: type II toxin-antitoxin system HicA family toxin [Firmicutes bacterium]|nr:type II toxin-antitoxin system HicA family toxin [Bacillota bacterium]
MSKHDKLLKRLLSRPRDFTFDELKTLLGGLGYIEDSKGKTSGARIAFIHIDKKHIIRLHRPHPGNELKLYQVDQVIEALKNQGVIE